MKVTETNKTNRVVMHICVIQIPSMKWAVVSAGTDDVSRPINRGIATRHPATVMVSMYNRVDDFHVGLSFNCDHYQAVYEPYKAHDTSASFSISRHTSILRAPVFLSLFHNIHTNYRICIKHMIYLRAFDFTVYSTV